MSSTTKLVTIFPRQKHGGPLSFTNNFIKALKKYGITINQALHPNDIGPILLINGTRKLFSLLKCKLKRRRIVLRLGSPENLQRHLDIKLSIKFKSGLIQILLIFLRKYIANAVIYQSSYVKEEWLILAGPRNNEHVIYNGVDTNFFAPSSQQRENIILSVEGSQGNDPFDIVINLHNELIKNQIDFQILMLGKPHLNIKDKVTDYNRIEFVGEVSKENLLDYYRRAKCYLLTDYLGAGCPNALLEAMACGCIPLAFQSGPVSEMYSNGIHGFLVKDTAKISAGEHFSNYQIMAKDVVDIFTKHERKSHASRKLAVKKYNLDIMRNAYAEVLWPLNK